MRPLRPETLLTLILLAFLMLSGCSSKPKVEDVTFRPMENETSSAEGQPEATYLLPLPTASEGKVNIVYHGIEDAFARNSQTKVPSLHLQLVVSNASGKTPWTVDVRSQHLSLKNETKTMSPTWAYSKGSSLPIVRIDPETSQTIDLYYALPEDKRTALEVPGFTLNWQVWTEKLLVAEPTTFDQIQRVGRNVSVYPFAQQPINRDPYLRPYGPAIRDPASIGLDSDWWMDPFTDVPPPWRDMTY